MSVFCKHVAGVICFCLLFVPAIGMESNSDSIDLDQLAQSDINAIQHQITQTEHQIKKVQIANQRSKATTGLLGVLLFGIVLLATVHTYQYRKKLANNKVLLIKIEEANRELDMVTEKLSQSSEKSQQLIQANLGLERGNTVKDRLLSIISHDLRSPMSSLQALLNLFNANNIARKDLVDFFGKLLSRVENTSTMLENLLHWSHHQLNGIDPIFCKVDVQQVVDDSINFYRMQAEQKHITMDNSLKLSILVKADVEMLKIILRNLISNALKFTHEGGVITLKVSQQENDAIVSVQDTGVGISPEHQEQMFSMTNFTTLGTGKEKGTGLGLLLCKDFVEHNGGKLWMDSQEGVGTTFYFSVPLT